jgi:hypothetical protein
MVIIYLIVFLLILLYAFGFTKERCIFCKKIRMRKHLEFSNYGVYFCKPDYITVDFLTKPISEFFIKGRD